MDAEINDIFYMELYSGPKMAQGKYKKTNVARLIDRDSTVFVFVFHDFSALSEYFYHPFRKLYLSLQPYSALNCSVQCSSLCPLPTRSRCHTDISI
jgi:hypothetical protein